MRPTDGAITAAGGAVRSPLDRASGVGDGVGGSGSGEAGGSVGGFAAQFFSGLGPGFVSEVVPASRAHRRAAWAAACCVGAAGGVGVVLAVAGAPAWLAAVGSSVCAAGAAWWVQARRASREAREMALLSADADALAGLLSTRSGGPRQRRGPATSLAEVRDRLADEQYALTRRVGETLGELDVLRSLLDAVDEPILAFDETGVVTLVNNAARGVLPNGDRLLGTPSDELFTLARVHRLLDHARAGVAGTDRVPMSVEGQTRTYEVAATPVRGSRGRATGAVLLLRDITALSGAAQLKTDFVANASHELRTPIASIKAAVETLEAAGDDPAMVSRLAQILSSSTTRLEEMVRDLLDLGRLEQPELAVRADALPLSDLASRLAPPFDKACAERDLTLRFEIEPPDAVVRTDEYLLSLVLRNLIDNAVKFAHEGTEVVATMRIGALERRDPGEGERRRQARFEHDATLELRVFDRGEGIPLKQQQRVFERFYQVDASRARSGNRRGTGLGLAIVKHAVGQLGGTVTLESVWQQGTTVTVRVPTRRA